MFGGGKYFYKSLEATNCQFFGDCSNKNEMRVHPQCNDKKNPTVGLVEWVKCCFHDRFQKTIRTHDWDVSVATGDEYCNAFEASSNKANFRFYFGSLQMKFNKKLDDIKTNTYLPLGSLL